MQRVYPSGVETREGAVGDEKIIAPRGLFTSESDYRKAVEKRQYDESWTDHLWRFHWQLYAIATFAKPASDEHVRCDAERFIYLLGRNAYGCMAWGRGVSGGHEHIHFLLGGIWTGRVNMKSWGTDHIGINMQIVRRKWTHGLMPKVEKFDPSRRSLYLVDHHTVEIVGKPKKHRR